MPNDTTGPPSCSQVHHQTNQCPLLSCWRGDRGGQDVGRKGIQTSKGHYFSRTIIPYALPSHRPVRRKHRFHQYGLQYVQLLSEDDIPTFGREHTDNPKRLASLQALLKHTEVNGVPKSFKLDGSMSTGGASRRNLRSLIGMRHQAIQVIARHGRCDGGRLTAGVESDNHGRGPMVPELLFHRAL
ncbi:uncharacterized protein BCR38DRAFT_180862 [Pseudomassariella vexata]|uniref:Uncharacterized protein n=1 Tax=Pseudomassariella vexata TaxID=1141098 RepID=A0A1Y2E4I2_9PEZI|nr:uncharacterized protein BCR38DRAFT_180862 [Pseudomassariella vexata]ORY66468.1 hypothetical protein BCR38DRAFT_180862 [Pseudomassariella vexata]